MQVTNIYECAHSIGIWFDPKPLLINSLITDDEIALQQANTLISSSQVETNHTSNIDQFNETNIINTIAHNPSATENLPINLLVNFNSIQEISSNPRQTEYSPTYWNAVCLLRNNTSSTTWPPLPRYWD